MAEVSWPDPAASHAVTDVQYEQLMAAHTGDGIVGTPTDAPVVYADSSGMQVKIKANRYGLVRGHGWGSGSVDFTKTITANGSGNPRIDLVVLQLDRSTWKVTTVVKTGTPSATPAIPALQQDADTVGAGAGKWEIPLATVAVANGAATIAPGNVTPLHWYLGTPILQTTSSTRPSPRPGLVLSEAGDYLVSVGSQFVRLCTVNDAAQFIGGRFQAGQPNPYSNGFGFAEFSRYQPSLISGHLYEIHLGCTAFTGAGGDLDVRVTLWCNGTVICLDEHVIGPARRWARFSLTAPYTAPSTGVALLQACAQRESGTTNFDIYAGTDTNIYWRVLDLGSRVPIGA
jgi:hypothetical protein